MTDASRGQEAWQVVIIKHGTRLTVRSDAYMNYEFFDEPDGPHRVDYYFWVLRRGDEAIIVDTGYSRSEGLKRGREVLVDPVEAVRALGLDPAAGHPVVITHAHYDHIGNAAQFSRSPLYIAREEFDFWTSQLAAKRMFTHFGDPTAAEILATAGADERLRVFDDETEIAPGVRVRVVGGHTPGQSIVEVLTSEGPVILASDAMHFHEELLGEKLFQSMTDLPKSYAVLDELRGMGAAHIVSGHDADELQRHTPVTGLLGGLAATIGDR